MIFDVKSLLQEGLRALPQLAVSAADVGFLLLLLLFWETSANVFRITLHVDVYANKCMFIQYTCWCKCAKMCERGRKTDIECMRD